MFRVTKGLKWNLSIGEPYYGRPNDTGKRNSQKLMVSGLLQSKRNLLLGTKVIIQFSFYVVSSIFDLYAYCISDLDVLHFYCAVVYLVVRFDWKTKLRPEKSRTLKKYVMFTSQYVPQIFVIRRVSLQKLHKSIEASLQKFTEAVKHRNYYSKLI